MFLAAGQHVHFVQLAQMNGQFYTVWNAMEVVEIHHIFCAILHFEIGFFAVSCRPEAGLFVHEHVNEAPLLISKQLNSLPELFVCQHEILCMGSTFTSTLVAIAISGVK